MLSEMYQIPQNYMNSTLQNYNVNLICNCQYYYGTELNNLCWVTEISQRQVSFVAIMRPPVSLL